MAGYNGLSMSNNAVDAYGEGKKPLSNITKEDILQHGVDVSLALFKWYIRKHCRPCEWHHTSPKYNATYFYDIKECCDRFKRGDLAEIKAQYKNRPRPKPKFDVIDMPYYAKVEYSESTFSGRRRYFTRYAVIYKHWAYMNVHAKKRILGSHFNIVESYPSRPEEMLEATANSIMAFIIHSQKSK